MPKIQGKQIADSTILQQNLDLATPTSGQTHYAATVEYVNDYISTHSGTIGPAEDGDYTDGIFTDFTDNTPIGTAIDRFNEMFLKLAPTPPTTDWNAFSNLRITNTLYSARALTSGSVVSNITTSATPTYTIDSTVGLQAAARALPTSPDTVTLAVTDTAGLQESEVIYYNSTGESTGVIRYTVADPYAGIAGKQDFWTGITSVTVNGTLPSITASSSVRSLTFSDPYSVITYNYYVDSVSTPSVSVPTITVPSMTTYVSGVPTLYAGQTISGITFTISNAVSYFYNNSMWDITGTLVNSVTNQAPTTIPTTQGQQVSESGKSNTVKGSVFSDTSFSFTVTARNIVGTSGSNNYTTTSLRVDTVSNESARILSGAGSYPASGYGGSYDSTVSLLSGAYVNELQLRNGYYVYPTVNYSAVGGPNYSTATGTRWVTVSYAFTNKSNFRITFSNPTGISASSQSGLLVEAKVDGSTPTYWVDGDTAYGGTGNPGTGSNGTAACTQFTTSTRDITFGTQVLTGTLYVRIGLTGSGVTFSGITVTALS